MPLEEGANAVKKPRHSSFCQIFGVGVKERAFVGIDARPAQTKDLAANGLLGFCCRVIKEVRGIESPEKLRAVRRRGCAGRSE